MEAHHLPCRPCWALATLSRVSWRSASKARSWGSRKKAVAGLGARMNCSAAAARINSCSEEGMLLGLAQSRAACRGPLVPRTSQKGFPYCCNTLALHVLLPATQSHLSAKAGNQKSTFPAFAIGPSQADLLYKHATLENQDAVGSQQ